MKNAHRERQGLQALPHLTERDNLALGRWPGNPGASLSRAHRTRRYQHTTIRMTEIIKTICTKYCEDVKELELVHCWWECEMTQLLWKIICHFLKIKHRLAV